MESEFMNQKGFTLVELLAVIIVIGLLASFALPQVLNQFNNNAGKLSEQQKNLIEESAYSYLLENESKYKNATKKCVTIKQLVTDDALDETFAKQVFGDDYATKNDGVSYSYQKGTLNVELGICN